jgi:hypothetical protein
MICDICPLRIPKKKPNMHNNKNNMCYDCWVWLE